MNLEMFGINGAGKIEYLGRFHKESEALAALDEFVGLGYKNVRFINWIAK